ncbi:MAG: DmsE family decaheme c-type cytochrome [Gammaproteobacteria bacterium]|nr:DmsE family decaheme c-type cytochrome [Gammaproteobacteria bacterium]
MNDSRIAENWRWWAVVPLVWCLAGLPGASSAADVPARQLAAKDMVLIGDAVCTKCHDESEEYPVLAIGKTRHGVTADARTPGCTSCHGESEEHARKGSDKDRPKPDITYRDMRSAVPHLERVEGELGYGLTPVAERNRACLNCHQGGAQLFWSNSTHATRDVACTNCHQVHTDHDRVREQRDQTEVCFNCHKEQRAQLHRPSHHPVLEGQMGCSDCHNPHGSAGPKQLKRDSVNETCYTCHMEKRGPFVHNHQPVTEDCTICHNAHGTIVANLLKYRPPYLCQECHSHTSHPGQLPGLPGGRTTSTSSVGTIARGCLNCHTNIHGGNSTQNSATAGRFRR